MYVGRACRGYPQSPLGNPYRSSPEHPKGEAIARYRVWLKGCLDARTPEVCDEVLRLARLTHEGENVVLLCWCAPTAEGLRSTDPVVCHGQVVAGVVEQVARRMAVSP